MPNRQGNFHFRDRSHCRNPVRAGGFSLVEVLIAMLLIAISGLAMMRMQTELTKRAEFAEHSQAALRVMDAKLKWFTSRGASTALSSISVADFASDVQGGQDATHPVYKLSWSVPTIALSGSLKVIEMEAWWQDRHGAQQHISAQTLLSQFSEFEP